MARNSEKTQTQLNRYLQAKKAEKSVNKYSFDTKKRPHLASTVTNVEEAEYWLRSIISDFKSNLSKITFQRSLNNEEIRDLNDRLNKILRIKKYWEKQVKLLGGKDYSIKPTTTTNTNNNNNNNNEDDVVEDDSIIDESTGYIYFGAAKNLPGVKQLYNKQNKAKNADNAENKNSLPNNLNKRALLNRVANSDYLAESEEKAKELAEIEQHYKQNKQKKQKTNYNGSDNDNDEEDTEDNNNNHKNVERKANDTEDTKAMMESEEYKYYANLATITSNSIQFPFQLPTKEQIEADIVQQERNLLLAQYSTS